MSKPTTFTYGNRAATVTADEDGTFSVCLEDAFTVNNFATFGAAATYAATALGSVEREPAPVVEPELDTSTLTEVEALGIVRDLSSRFGWTLTLLTRADAESYADRDLTDEEWDRLRRSKGWELVVDDEYLHESMFLAFEWANIKTADDIEIENEMLVEAEAQQD